ncbi:uncharacterized protein SAPINGB_P001031 [Magnusiomyces paraingens]|uniref:F-box domain-containing protein n=1 Tax=Magnusiomyces paraingens TaxID=2606893 RepID=A0A5E8B9U5_9ASCO|nr:uncharacterized protein SAPINGB_P001031 [Saprochaete ingens]VVT46070.1 unnamed protein product [Saprochaete ingens]
MSVPVLKSNKSANANNEASFICLSPEIHCELVKFLSIRDCIAVSQACTTFRNIYRISSWTHCDLALISSDQHFEYINRHKEIWEDESWESWDLKKIQRRQRRHVFPLSCILNPNRYSWVLPNIIRTIRVLNVCHELPEQSQEYEFLENALNVIATSFQNDRDSNASDVSYNALRKLTTLHAINRTGFDKVIKSNLLDVFLANNSKLPLFQTESFDLRLQINTNTDKLAAQKIPESVSQTFSCVTELEVVGKKLFASHLPSQLKLEKLRKLSLHGLRAPFLTNILEMVAKKSVAPVLSELYCELGVHQRQTSIYVQSAIGAVAELPSRISYCMLRLVNEDEGGYIRLGSAQDAASLEMNPLFNVPVVTDLIVEEDSFDLTLFSRLVRFPRLSFLRTPPFNLTSLSSEKFSYQYFNPMNRLTKLSYEFGTALFYERQRALTLLPNLRHVQFSGGSPDLVPYIPELLDFFCDAFLYFSEHGKILSRDQIHKMLAGKHKAMVPALKEVRFRLDSEQYSSTGESYVETSEFDEIGDNYSTSDEENNGELHGDEAPEQQAQAQEQVVTSASLHPSDGNLGDETNNETNHAELLYKYGIPSDENISGGGDSIKPSQPAGVNDSYFDKIVEFLTYMFYDPTECFREYQSKIAPDDFGMMLLLGLCCCEAYFDIILDCKNLETASLDMRIARMCYPSLRFCQFLEQYYKNNRSDLTDLDPRRHKIKQYYLVFGHNDEEKTPCETMFNEMDDCLEVNGRKFFLSKRYGMFPYRPNFLKMRRGEKYMLFMDFEQKRNFHIPPPGGKGVTIRVEDFWNRDFDGWI